MFDFASRTLTRSSYFVLFITCFWNSRLSVADYNPLSTPLDSRVESLELTVEDQPRARKVPLKLYLPVGLKQPLPVVLFSHGLGGTKDGNGFMGEHWAKRGYIAVFTQHVGSDDSVWRGVEMRERLNAMRNAASAQNLFLRCGDIKSVLDQLEIWNREPQHPLSNMLDLTHLGMSGHSFGAHTTQATSGQSFPLVGQKFVDSRIDAAIAFSPSAPARKSDAAFASVRVPWFLMTGTKDTVPIGDQSAESRLEVYPNLPKTLDKYELLLDNAEHSAFTDRALPGDKEKRNPNHHRLILAMSTAFWDAYLKEDKDAKSWLLGEKAKSMLQPKDRLQHYP